MIAIRPPACPKKWEPTNALNHGYPYNTIAMAVNTVNNASHAYFQLFSGISIHYDPERFSKIRFVFSNTIHRCFSETKSPHFTGVRTS